MAKRIGYINSEYSMESVTIRKRMPMGDNKLQIFTVCYQICQIDE